MSELPVDSNQSRANGRQVKQHQKRLVVSIRSVATPDAEERIRRAIDLLLQAAARDTQSSRESTRT